MKTTKFRTLRILTVLGASIALVATSASVSSAAPDSDEQVQSLIQRVAPNQGTVSQGMSLGGKTRFNSTNVEVEIPDAASVPVSIEAEKKATLHVSLPKDLKLNNGKSSSDGTVVYQSQDNSVDAAVQSMTNGSVRIQTIIRSASSPHEFSYGIGNGFQPVEAPDGSIYVIGFDADGKYTAFGVKPAWARDASGKSVPTNYEIRGGDLIQVVTPSSQTEYPVVADPTWEWYQAAYGAGLNKSETKALADQGSLGFFCGALALVGVGIGAAWCGIFGGAIFHNTKRAASENGCIFIAAVPVPVAVGYNSQNCY